MKKNIRNLLILVLVLAVLGGAAAALLLWPEPQEEEDPASSSEVSAAEVLESIFDHDISEIAAIDVENSNGGYSMTCTENSGGLVYTLEGGYEDYDLIDYSVDNTAISIFYAETARELGKQENLADFGLTGEDAAKITITYTDGSKDEITVGNTAAETSGRYVLKDGEVYILYGLSEYLFRAPTVFVNTSLYTVADRVADEGETVYDETGVQDVLYSMTLSGSNFPNTIEMKYDTGVLSEYKITAPVTADAGNERLETVISDLKSLTASSVAAVGLTDEVLEEYGLDEPFAKIEFDMNHEKHTLQVSAASGGTRYLLCDDLDVVYEIAQSTVESWAEADILKLRLSYVLVPMINDVKRLTYTVEGDMVYAYDVTREVNEEISTDARVNYDLTVTNAGGTVLDTENYRHLYTRMLSTAVLSSDPTEFDESKPVLSIKFEYFEGGSDTIAYYAAGNDRYIAVLNGKFNGVCRASEVDSAISYVSVLEEGGEVPSFF